MDDPRPALLDIFAAALRAVDGRKRVRAYLGAHRFHAPVYLIAIGKAACAMAHGAHDALGETIRDALVVTKQGHTEMLPWPVFEAGHPMPDARSLDAGQRLLGFIATLPQDAHVLLLLSGGASALVEALPAGVDLAQLQQINDWLLAGGFDIAEINRVRKRLSLLKGGRLAQRLVPRTVTCLAISDVPGDDPRVIGSGLVVADASLPQSFADPLPDAVRTLFDNLPPLPAPTDPGFARVQFHIVARLDDAKRAAAEFAAQSGWQARVMPEFVAGDAVEAGARLAHFLRDAQPNTIYVWGGEPTVKLPSQPGRGGRNQSLALAAALALSGDAYLLCAGSDGSDGATDDAGALVDSGTLARGALHGYDAREALTRADAGTFLDASGDLIHTGPTGTNVMDLMLGIRIS